VVQCWWILLLCLQPTVPGSASSGALAGEQAAILYPREVLAGVPFVGQHTGEYT